MSSQHRTSTLNKLIGLWGMSRPLIMISVVLVFFGGQFHASALGYPLNGAGLVWGLVALLLVAASIHYTNEYADADTDKLTHKTPFSGGSGVLPRGLVSRPFALHAAWVSLLLGVTVGLVGWTIGVLPLVAVLVLAVGALGGWMYSLPPLRLAWCSAGEADNALLGGMMLPLYGYTVQTGQVDGAVLAAWLPFTLLVFNNLLATTWADRRADIQVGKYTLATRLSPSRLRLLYWAVALVSFGLLPLVTPLPVMIGGLLAIPLVVWGGLSYTRWESPLPSVAAMMVFLLGQMGGWLLVP